MSISVGDQPINGTPAGATAYIENVKPESWEEIDCPPKISGDFSAYSQAYSEAYS